MDDKAAEDTGLVEQETIERTDMVPDVQPVEEPVNNDVLSPAEQRAARIAEIDNARLDTDVIKEYVDVEEPAPVVDEGEDENLIGGDNPPPVTTDDDGELPAVAETSDAVDAPQEEPGKQYNLNVYGSEKKVTFNELRNLAERAAGADQKYNNAAEMLRKAEELQKQYEQPAQTTAQPAPIAQAPLPSQDAVSNQLPSQDVGSSALPENSDVQLQADVTELIDKAVFAGDEQAKQQLNHMLNRRFDQPQTPQQVDIESMIDQRVNQRMVAQEIDAANRQIAETHGELFNDPRIVAYANAEIGFLKESEPGYGESHYMLQAAANIAARFAPEALQNQQAQASVEQKTAAKAKHSSAAPANSQSAKAVGRQVADQTDESYVEQMRKNRFVMNNGTG